MRTISDGSVPTTTVNKTRQYSNLLQINEYTDTKIIQCKIEIYHTIFYCGTHSHVSIVLSEENEYIMDVNREICIDAHKTGIIKISDTHVVHGIRWYKILDSMSYNFQILETFSLGHAKS